MTREQQQSTRELEASISKFLQSYGWKKDGSYWRHPSIKNAGRFTDWDALSETRARPTLGWSQLAQVKG